MPKSQSKRAIEGRKWRVSAREKRRLNTIVTEYVRLKHTTIYEECSNLYNSIVKNYSENQNLTKTREFRELIGDYTQSDESRVSSNEVDEPAKTVHEPANNDAEPANKAVHDEAVDDEAVHEAVHDEAVHDEAVYNEAVSIGDTYNFYIAF